MNCIWVIQCHIVYTADIVQCICKEKQAYNKQTWTSVNKGFRGNVMCLCVVYYRRIICPSREYLAGLGAYTAHHDKFSADFGCVYYDNTEEKSDISRSWHVCF
jgi:hypothetical protein